MLAIALKSPLFADTYACPGLVCVQPKWELLVRAACLSLSVLHKWFYSVHAVECRTALRAYVIDVIHSLVDEQISPVLVRLATTGPQVPPLPM